MFTPTVGRWQATSLIFVTTLVSFAVLGCYFYETCRSAANNYVKRPRNSSRNSRLVTVTVVERNDTPLATPEETDYEYDLAGNLASERLPNGLVTDYQYDQLNRLTVERVFADLDDNGVFDSGTESLLAEYDYDVALDGKRTGVTETDDQARTTRIDWLYDNLGRLTRETYNSYNSALDYTANYVMDLVGNRLQKTVDKGSDSSVDQTIDYMYDANDRLLTERSDAAGTGDDRFTRYSYGSDATASFGGSATQQTKKAVRQGLNDSGAILEDDAYQYNLQGQMSSSTTDLTGSGGGVTAAAYTYDDNRVRTSQTVNGAKTVYLYDSQNPTGYAKILEEKDASGNVTKTYTLGHNIIAQQSPTIVSGGTLYLSKDGHGSVRVLLDSSGAVVLGQVYSYDACGVEIGFDPANALTSIRYAGEVIDQTGLSYNLRRYYAAATGTFTTFDPYTSNKEDAQPLHKYLYCHADPINYIDPTGMFGFSLGSLLSGIGFGMSLGGAIGGVDAALGGESIGLGIVSGAVAGGLLGAGGALFPAVFASSYAVSFGMGFSVPFIVSSFLQGKTAQGAFRVCTGIGVPLLLYNTAIAQLRVAVPTLLWRG